MKYFRFKVDAPTFSAELALDPFTHRVIHAAPVLSWLIGIDRFSLFRLAVHRDWHLTQTPQLNYEKPELTQQLTDSFSEEHAAAASLPREASADAD